MPREGKFSDLFNDHADLIVEGGRELLDLMSTPAQAREQASRHQQGIDTIEKRADKITHEAIALLHKTFITPFDRDGIHQLITAMDDILDLMQDAAESMTLYDVRDPTPESRHLTEICVSCAERVRSAVRLLSNMDNGPAILSTCREIDQFESEADRVMRAAISKVFRDEPDVRELIKLQAIYELLEAVTDRCEDVANIIEGIVLENS